MKKSHMATIAIVLVLAVASFLVLKSDPQTAGEATEQQDDHGESGDHEELKRITLHKDAPILERLRLEKAGPDTILQEIELPGEIVLNADKTAHIVPRFAGIVQTVGKNLGDRVEANDVLAIIQSNQSVSAYQVKSLVPGTIIEKRITLGEFVRDDADIYVVADLSTVWVKISVYAKYMPLIKTGLQVHITASGIDEGANGKIDYVGPIMGERTRTGSARLTLSNPHGLWQPGLFVTARIVVAQVVAKMAVPDEAVQTINDQPVVFVREGDEFEVRPVKLGRTDGKKVEILEGLKAGDEYVAAESYIFKAELGKSEAGEE